MIGAVLFIVLFLQTFELTQLGTTSNIQDSVAVGVYYLGVVVCFVLSTIFHTFSDHSPGVHKFGNELDHLGIVLVMWGTGVSGAYFAFHPSCADSQLLRNAYFTALTSTAIGCGVFTLRPRFRRPQYRPTRFLMYVFLGASLFAPVGHGLARFGGAGLARRMGLGSFVGLGLVNFAGAAVYAARVPERWWPRRFDLLGQSHNWMHLLVLAGALVRLRGLLETAGRWREGAVVC